MAKSNVKVKFKGKTYQSIGDVFSKQMKLVGLKYVKKLAPKMKTLVLGNYLARGVSPVKNRSNFKAYSPSYKKAIKAGRYPGKTIRPVNLKLHGDLWNSFYVRRSRSSLTIGFSDPKAVWHNTGAGRLPKRRILPTGTNETFKPKILNYMHKTLTDIVKKEFK